MKYDIIVVGAGPGGANAAYHAARQGAKVLVIDKKTEIGVPVRCGEAIIEIVLKEHDIKLDPHWISNTITKIKSTSSKNRVIELSTTVKGYILDRKYIWNFSTVKALELLREYEDIILRKNEK